MLGNRKLSKAISDCSWSELVRQVEYKAKWYGRTVLKVGRFFPSSRTCSACGLVNRSLSLGDREWTCSCGARHQRDPNAATNILREGLRISTAGTAGLANCLGIRPISQGQPTGLETHPSLAGG